jgi:hypothetical protein
MMGCLKAPMVAAIEPAESLDFEPELLTEKT